MGLLHPILPYVPYGLLAVAGLLVALALRVLQPLAVTGKGPALAPDGAQRGRAAGVLALVAFWQLCYAAELLLPGEAATLGSHRVSYLSIALLPPLALLFAWHSSPGRAPLPAPLRALLYAAPAVTLALSVPSPLSPWLWEAASVVPEGPFRVVDTLRGPWFSVHTAFSYACLVAAWGLFVGRYLPFGWACTGQIAGMTLAFLVPVAGNGLHVVLDRTGYLDLTPLALGVTAGAVAFVLAQDRRRELLPVAREHLVRELSAAVLVVDGRERVLESNAAASPFLRPDPASGEPRLAPEIRALVKGGHRRASLRTGREPPREYDVRVLPLRAPGLSPRVRVVGVRDITPLREGRPEAAPGSEHDSLTGLPSRRAFEKALARAAEGEAAAFAVALLGVDRLRRVNASFGHDAGDLVLRELARRLGEATPRLGAPGEVFLARFAGDELAALLPGVTTHEAAERAARRLAAAASSTVYLGEAEITAKASVGLAVAGAHGASPSELLRSADVALAAAKRDRLAWRVFDPEAPPAVRPPVRLEAALGSALQRGELELHYQPLFSAELGELTGAESLLRWRREGRVVPAAEFIEVLEETGLIVPVGEWSLVQTFEHLAKLRSAGLGPLRMCVNVTPYQLAGDRFPQLLRELPAFYGVEPGRIELEVTERVVLAQDGATLEKLRAIHAQGYRLALDDFGTGYSSLAYLHRLPFDRVKVDRAFVSRLGSEAAAHRLTRAIVEMAHGLGLEVTAEGVEEPVQARLLRELGCDELQGFGLGLPMPFDALEPFVAQRAGAPAL